MKPNPLMDPSLLSQVIMEMAPYTKTLSFKQGDDLNIKDDTSIALYYVDQGSVEVSYFLNDTKITVAVIGNNSFFGEIGYFDGVSRIRDIRAVSDTVVRIFYRDHMETLRDNDPELYGRFITLITQSICLKFRDILHDIGKVAIPDSILLKPSRLTSEEFEVIKLHCKFGGDALKELESQIDGTSYFTLGKEIAYYHHKKWDGTGYLENLKGTDIPLSARIVALTDVYDALTAKRIYKDAYPHQVALDMIVSERGTHFDPDIVDAFLVNAEKFREIKNCLKN